MSGTCIVYVMEHESCVVNNSALMMAQQEALEQRVPMVVVFCLVKWDKRVLEKLQTVETQLATYVVPLIILVGEAQKTLAGFIHHTQPISIYHESSISIPKKNMNKHPYPWPGVVIPIAGLMSLKAAGKINC